MSKLKSTQYLHVSPLAPIALLLVGTFFLLPVLPNAVVLGAYVLATVSGTSEWSFSTFLGHVGRACIPLTAGGLLLAAGVRLRAWLRDTELRQARFLDRPWMCRSDWSAKRISLDNFWPKVAVLVLITASVLVLLWFAVFVAEGKAGNSRYWFPAVIVVIMFGGIRLYALNRKWRGSELRLGTLPGVIGGPFRAVVMLSEDVPQGASFRVTLQCEKSTWTRRGSESTPHSEETLWQADAVIGEQLGGRVPGQTALPVYFAIPYRCQPTIQNPDRSGTNVTKITWWLSVRSSNEQDFRSIRFEVPVFKTAESSPDYREDPTVLAGYEEFVEPESVLQSLNCRQETLPAGAERLSFSLFRWDFVVFWLLLSTVSLFGLAAILGYVRPYPLTCIAALIPAVLLVAGVVSLVEMLLWRSSITISDKIEITAGYWGRRQTVVLSREQKPTLTSDIEFTGPATDRRRICIQTPSHGSITLIKRLEGRQQADAMVNWLEKRIRD